MILFLEKAYEYYPKNIDAINNKEKYILTNEFKKLLSTIEKHKKNLGGNSDLFRKLKKTNNNQFILSDDTFFQWNDRCYTFSFSKVIDNNTTICLKYYKSILIPYFYFTPFYIKKNGERYIYLNIDKNNFPYPNLVHNIKQISKEENLIEFDSKLINRKINNINFDDIKMGHFTLFNTFFLSQNINQ